MPLNVFITRAAMYWGFMPRYGIYGLIVRAAMLVVVGDMMHDVAAVYHGADFMNECRAYCWTR